MPLHCEGSEIIAWLVDMASYHLLQVEGNNYSFVCGPVQVFVCMVKLFEMQFLKGQNCIFK